MSLECPITFALGIALTLSLFVRLYVYVPVPDSLSAGADRTTECPTQVRAL